jgi:hypothetical protein
VYFCGRREEATEDVESKNAGNFKAALDFRVDSGDEVLRDHFKNAPANATYTSKGIQNEIITTFGRWIQKQILYDLNSGSKIFSIIADESRDSSNKEQMPVIIRYVNRNAEIVESFLAFVECAEGTTGAQLAALLQETCHTLNLDLSYCRGQGYDGYVWSQ